MRCPGLVGFMRSAGLMGDTRDVRDVRDAEHMGLMGLMGNVLEAGLMRLEGDARLMGCTWCRHLSSQGSGRRRTRRRART
ncbi:hypothetical protein DDQ41_08905 [Streptomyces spongiicola]|uniref:Tn3 transposase DDE domain-containing protein n=1 Tax=Streptomyces spongiicola TaxID=1690221 RepID=A0ABN5KHY4_9ACTN|nr:hypothetical protein DDQ41_08905 [Streptomyces spongiicola]